MRLECVRNTGEALGPRVHGLRYGDKTRFTVSIGQVYRVYGMSLFDSGLTVLIKDDYENPNWMPIGLFTVTENGIPSHWIFRYFPDDQPGIPGREGRQAVWGYKELVLSDDHFNGLINLEVEALKRFYSEEETDSAESG